MAQIARPGRPIGGWLSVSTQLIPAICNASELARVLAVTPTTIHAWITEGLPFERIGRNFILKKDQIVEWLTESGRVDKEHRRNLNDKMHFFEQLEKRLETEDKKASCDLEKLSLKDKLGVFVANLKTERIEEDLMTVDVALNLEKFSPRDYLSTAEADLKLQKMHSALKRQEAKKIQKQTKLSKELKKQKAEEFKFRIEQRKEQRRQFLKNKKNLLNEIRKDAPLVQKIDHALESSVRELEQKLNTEVFDASPYLETEQNTVTDAAQQSTTVNTNREDFYEIPILEQPMAMPSDLKRKQVQPKIIKLRPLTEQERVSL